MAAGLLIRRMRDSNIAATAVALDAAEQCVFFGETPEFEYMQKRSAVVPLGKPILLKVVNRLEHVEIYVNDELLLTFARYRGIGGGVGLFVDRGLAHFCDIRLRSLCVDRPQ